MAEEHRSSKHKAKVSSRSSHSKKSSHSSKEGRSKREHRSKREGRSSSDPSLESGGVSSSDDLLDVKVGQVRESRHKKKRRPKTSRTKTESSFESDDVKVGRVMPERGVDDFDGEISTYAIPPSLSAPTEAAGMPSPEHRHKDHAGKERWDHYSSEAKQEEGDDNESFGGLSTQFSTASISSVFSTPATRQPSSRSVRKSDLKPAASASKPGAVFATSNSEGIQDMLDRKFDLLDEDEEDDSDEDEEVIDPLLSLTATARRAPVLPFMTGASASDIRPGAHHETREESDRIQDVLDRKFNEMEGSDDAEEQQQEAVDMPEVVVANVDRQLSSFGVVDRPQTETATVTEPSVALTSSRLTTASSVPIIDTSINEYGTQKRHCVAQPPPDVLTNQLMDGGIVFSGVEQKEMRLAAGLCTECGRTQTHEKIKYGPFQAFRRMDPLTTPGSVYKGYCLYCNTIQDLRRYLHEPYLREQDLNGSALDPLLEEAAICMPSTDEDLTDSTCKNRRFQVLLCVVVLAIVSGGVALAMVIAGSNSSLPMTRPTPPPQANVPVQAPTEAPGPREWTQVGPDITEIIASFGFKVSMDHSGSRVAVSSPKDRAGAGRVDIYELIDMEGNKLWTPVGPPILGASEGVEGGYDIALSGDGNSIIVGYPGNGNGFVRVLRYSKDVDKWKLVGKNVVGVNFGGRAGSAVAINPDGTVIAVGEPYDTAENGSEAGRARVFKLNSVGEWEQVGQDLLGSMALDRFGTSVDIDNSGTILAVGAPSSDERWQNGGQVHIFTLEGEQWIEPLKMKILGENRGHEYGSSMKLNGRGDTVISSAINAENDEGTPGGGDPRAVFIEYRDNNAEELGFGFAAIPDTLGLGYSVDIDDDGSKVVLSTMNKDGLAGKVMAYDIFGRGDWISFGEALGGDTLGEDEWLGQGPSVAIRHDGEGIAIGYESLIDPETEASIPVVRVYEFK